MSKLTITVLTIALLSLASANHISGNTATTPPEATTQPATQLAEATTRPATAQSTDEIEINLTWISLGTLSIIGLFIVQCGTQRDMIKVHGLFYFPGKVLFAIGGTLLLIPFVFYFTGTTMPPHFLLAQTVWITIIVLAMWIQSRLEIELSTKEQFGAVFFSIFAMHIPEIPSSNIITLIIFGIAMMIAVPTHVAVREDRKKKENLEPRLWYLASTLLSAGPIDATKAQELLATEGRYPIEIAADILRRRNAIIQAGNPHL